MRKHHPKNERIKRVYLTYLEEAKRCSVKTTDQVAAAIALFEQSTNWKDFAAFHIEQARAFKRQQHETINPKTGKLIAKATVHSRLMHLKAFFHWLAGQPGYKSRISYSDCDYFNPSANDTRIATARREKSAPTLEQVKGTIAAMPSETMIHKRDKAILALSILTGARDDALASLNIQHCDAVHRKLVQDARDVRTKNRKTFTTWFFPVGAELETIIANWLETLTGAGYGPNDPLFPATEIGLDDNRHFSPQGLSRRHWKNADAIRRIFRSAFESAGLPYFNPHSFRTTLARLGETICTTPEQFKAWSQNLGHENVLTTFTSYGQVSDHRQAEILQKLVNANPLNLGDAGENALAEMETLIRRMKASRTA